MQSQIIENAKQIRDLHEQIGIAFTEKRGGLKHRQACDKFHSSYDSLAFPGGYEIGIRKINEGDLSSIETALCFLEVKPYFFRSQYMRTKLTRLLKKADLTKSQQSRLNNVLKR